MKFSRTQNSVLNISAGILLQMLTIGLGFYSRQLFVNNLGYEVLGINGLFQNLVAILGLAEAGIGTAIICHLYRPLADGDQMQISSLMHLYGRAYRLISLVIAIGGLMAMPFIHLAGHGAFSTGFLRAAFALFLLETITACLFMSRKSLLIADQQNYLVNFISAGVQIVLFAFQIAILHTTGSYLLFVAAGVMLKIFEGLVLRYFVATRYPFLGDEQRPATADDCCRSVFASTRALMFHYLAMYFVRNTDNLIVSGWLGLAMVGRLANYQIVILAVKNIFSQFSNGMIASFGNLLALETPQKSESVFYTVFLGNFILFNFAAVALLNLTNPFLELWLGPGSLLPFPVLFLLVLDFFLHGVSMVAGALRASSGVFAPDRHLHLGASLLKLILSLALVKSYGVAGVVFGTVVYRFTEWHCILGWLLHRHVFKSGMQVFLKNSLVITAIFVVSNIVSYHACEMTAVATWQNWWTRAIICCIVPNLIALTALHRSLRLRAIIARFFRPEAINR